MKTGGTRKRRDEWGRSPGKDNNPRAIVLAKELQFRPLRGSERVFPGATFREGTAPLGSLVDLI